MTQLPTLRGSFAVGSLGPFPGFYFPYTERVEPLFTRRVAERIAHAYNALPCLDMEPARQAFYDRAADAFRFLDCVSGEWMVWCGLRLQGVAVYPIGRPEWTWDFVRDHVRKRTGGRGAR